MARTPRSRSTKPRKGRSERIREAPAARGPGRGTAIDDGPARRAKRRARARLASRAFGIGVSLLVGILLVFVIALAWMGDLSKLRDLEVDFDRRVSLSYQYSDGSVMRVEGDRPGPLIDIEQLPPHLVHAVLAAEDHKFFEHKGFRIGSMIAAAIANLEAGRVVRGGSTITQQLVKNTYGDRDRSVLRKLRELVIASKAESYFRARYGRRGGKNRILALYMSRIELGYEGNPVLGFEDAARHYYDRPARDLTLGQSALLAGLLANWPVFDPLRKYDAARARRDFILDQMLRFGFIQQDEVARAKAADDRPIIPRDRSYRYALDDIGTGVVAFARGRQSREDLAIRTTVDAPAQRLAAQIVAQRLRYRPELDAAFVAMTGDGAIRVMIGGRSYGERQFSAARSRSLNVGSLLKPFIFTAALQEGALPVSLCSDSPLAAAAGWSPANAYQGGDGDLSLERALAKSSNRVAVRLGEEVGRDKVLATLRQMGYPVGNVPDTRSWALTSSGSPLDIASAYLPFANGGRRVSHYLLDRITTPDGEVVKRTMAVRPATGIDPTVLATMRRMLNGVMHEGTGRTAAARLTIELGGKTGTTDGNRAGWFVGFGDGFVVAIWVGWTGAGNGPADVSGSGLPSLIFNDFMRQQRAAWIRGLSLPSPAVPPEKPVGHFVTGRARPGTSCLADQDQSERRRSASN